MHILYLKLQPSSLFSIRIPITHIASVTYACPPPSTLKGMLANALQRYERLNPIQAAIEVEDGILFSASKPETPIIASPCTVRTIVQELRGKRWRRVRDREVREYAYTKEISCVFVFKNDTLANRLLEAVRRAFIFLGDSESLVTVTDAQSLEANGIKKKTGDQVIFNTYAPANLFSKLREGMIVGLTEKLIIQRKGKYERAKLIPYVLPLRKERKLLKPIEITGELNKNATLIKANDQTVIMPETP